MIVRSLRMVALGSPMRPGGFGTRSRAFRGIRSLALGAVVIGAAACGSCRGGPAPADDGEQAEAEATSAGRLIILGFDGVDPDWLERWVAEGKLPTIDKLIKAHGGAAYRHLRSTNPPQSPVAWTSFATGTRPGHHGVFDFIRRKLVEGDGPLQVMPAIGTTEFEVHEVGPPTARNLRNGIPFWKSLADEGVPVVALNVPYSFPPDPMRDGRMLSGLGVPDLRETNSTFTYVGTDVTADEAKSPPGGGVLVPLEMSADGRGRFELEGPTIPGTHRRMTIPIEVRIYPGAHDMDPRVEEDLALKPGDPPLHGMSIEVQGRELRLEPRSFSDWTELTFRHGEREVRGVARFLPLETGPDTRLFITPISFHPRAPYSPISYPNEYAAEVADSLGRLYKTVGWDHDTSSLNAEVIDEELFLTDMDAVETDRRKMLMEALGRDDWRMLLWVSTSTDRVSHMFYRLIDPEHPMYDEALARRFGNAIEREYRRMDETVAQVLPKLREGDTLLILSDHGFHNFRRGLHLNQWLRQAGFLALSGDAEAAEREFLMDVDWSRTKAYALGTGQIYLNLRGREREGIVSEHQADAVCKEIRAGLLALRDEERGGAKPVRQVYLGSEVFEGERAEEAPDLQVAFAETYRTSWETILGGVPAGLFADNDRKWSGDHAASDVEVTDGILLSNRPLRDDVEIVDLAPTALSHFEMSVPSHYVGEPVLEEGP